MDKLYTVKMEKIKGAYQESKSWDKVVSIASSYDRSEAREAFIDFVEETYQTEVKDGKHLQSLTGITEESLEGLEEILQEVRVIRYGKALECALHDGSMYNDLLQIKPERFGLPESWEPRTSQGYDQRTSILWAINEVFRIEGFLSGGLLASPSLRNIAQSIEAPYSVVMDCYNLIKGIKL